MVDVPLQPEPLPVAPPQEPDPQPKQEPSDKPPDEPLSPHPPDLYDIIFSLQNSGLVCKSIFKKMHFLAGTSMICSSRGSHEPKLFHRGARTLN